MRVLHVIDSLGLGGGAEHSLADLLPHLRERGVDSQVITIRDRVGGLQERLIGEGFPVTVLSRPSVRGRIVDLKRQIVSQQPDVVHATLYNSCMISRFACLGSRVPLVNSLVSTSYDRARLEGIGVPAWKMAAVASADAVTARHLVSRIHAVNKAVADEAVSVLRVPPKRITIIPRGRSTESLGIWSEARRHLVRTRLGINAETPLILNVGRQVHAKAQKDLIAAFDLIQRQLPEAVLLIAGRDGDASVEVRQALSNISYPNQVRLLGHRTDVADLYVAADVMAFPSLYEGAAGGIIEAMALGCPVVGSDATAVSEVLRQGELGPVVPRGNPHALARELLSMLRNPQRRESLRRTGLDEFQKRYEITAVANATTDMYSQVIGESN